MNYQETLSYLFAQLPMYQRIGQAAYKADLANTYALMKILEEPQHSFKSIHIAGTNGKGSTSHLIAASLQQMGYKVGLYTSPHLIDFRERIKINGELIPEEEVIQFVASYKSQFESIGLSFFEWTVGLCFWYFRKMQIDIGVIETGMGGRLDSTNVITPLLSVITNISFDHKQFLGDTLEKIAGEKAGIIKPGVPVVVGEFHPETLPVFIHKANALGSEPIKAFEFETPDYECQLKGWYQAANKRTAYTALKVLARKDLIPVNEEAIKSGFARVNDLTGLMGRWQILRHNPKVITDVGHNAAGIEFVIHQLMNESYNQLHIVFGMVSDKEHDEVLELLPANAEYYLCKPDIPRGLQANLLSEKMDQYRLENTIFNDVGSAYKAALSKSKGNDLIFVGGSTFVVADFLKFLSTE